MPEITVLLSSPRVPTGLLSGDAWALLRSAERVLTRDASTPQARAIAAQGVPVSAEPDATDAVLWRLAADTDVVWLAADDGDPDLVQGLAGRVVAAAEAGAREPSVEVLVGSFDPPGARLLDLVEVMDRLRRECPWDREQTHESLVRYLVEEAYETIEAIESGDRDHLREELGDLLLQVVFHARIATEHADEPVRRRRRRRRHRREAGAPASARLRRRRRVRRRRRSRPTGRRSRRPRRAGTSVDRRHPAGLPALSLADKVIGRALRGRRSLSVPVPDETGVHRGVARRGAVRARRAAAQAAGIDPEQALRARVRARDRRGARPRTACLSERTVDRSCGRR